MTVKVLKGEHWLNRKWRPMMAVMYFVVCICDFIIFPILWSILQAEHHGGSIVTSWTPITLQGGGLFHVAMGAILGVTAWTRGQEKIALFNQGYISRQDYRPLPLYQNRNNIGRKPPQYDDPEI